MLTGKKCLDKIYGGWLGKCLGGAAGAPVEGVKKLLPYKDYKEIMRPDLPNDDLDIQLLWLEVMEEKGLSVTAEDLAKAWDKKCWYPFNEYGIFLKNYERGILPPYSGSFNNPLFSESEGCPIRSEIWGMLFYGHPECAAKYAEMDAILDHTGNAVWIEMYYAAMEADAFEERDIKKLIIKNMEYLPVGSAARVCVEDILKWTERYPLEWEKTRMCLMRKYAHHDFTNAVINLGIVALALLYGKEDLDKVINLAFRCGFDTDCTCATAGALWGIVHGASKIPEELKALINDELVIGIDVERRDHSIKSLAEDTYYLAERLLGEKRKVPDLELKINYIDRPAIGFEDSCKFKVIIKNNSKIEKSDTLKIKYIPEGWAVVPSFYNVTVKAEEEKEVEFEARTNTLLTILNNTNILQAVFGKCTKMFGIAGASEWEAVGPYFEALDKKDPEWTPSPHGEGCDLPTLECMVNNAVYLSKEYIDEGNILDAFLEEDTIRIHGYEDLLPLDEAFPYCGQGCVYLKQEIISEKEEEVWAVIGNNDGFRIWMNEELCMEKDEIRLWTPYNNHILLKLKKGKNQIILKLIRRTESLKFSIALRKYEGQHFHRKRWIVDLSCKK